MGILGSLLFPNNPELAKELNEKEDKLRKGNNLHNDLVNSYRATGEAIKNFDAYLMAIMAMHYHLAYTEEDLSNLPDDKVPALTKSWADTVENLALDTLSVKMAVDGFKAIKNGVANLFREGGIFNRAAPSGEGAIGEGLGGEVLELSARTPLLRSSSIDVLTTEARGSELEGMSSELGSTASELGEALESAEPAEELTEVSDVAETGTAAAKAGTEAASLGSKIASGASAVMGPALLVITAVTEIISAIHAGQEKSKLEDAKNKMDKALKDQDTALKHLKQVYTHLLKAGQADIKTYNKLLPDLYAMEKAPIYHRQGFSTGGIDAFISGMDSITIDNTGAVQGFQTAALQNVSDAVDFIRQQAAHDGTMSEAIRLIKTYMRREGITDLPDDASYLKELVDVMGIAHDQAVTYNKFRRLVAEYGAVLLPYHEKVKEDAGKDGGIAKPPKTVTPGKADPNFDPKPDQFTIPGIAVGGKS